jgi:small subunit ribosomal protein S1
MEYQKFIPEGWKDTNDIYTKEELNQAYQNGNIMEGLVYDCDENYNLHINLGNGVTGIIPRNELDAVSHDEYGFVSPSICKNKVNTVVQFKIKEMYSENQLMLSRKQVGEEALDWVKNNLEVGMTLNGIVRNIRKFGAFVEIGGGIVGLLRIEDISVSRIKSPEERLNIGQKINVMIKSIDKATGRIILSYKELLGNWEENVKDYKEKMIVDGIVKEADKYKNGIFIELKPNLVGLAEYKEGFYYGQKVKVFIKKIIEDKKKIKLIIMGG